MERREAVTNPFSRSEVSSENHNHSESTPRSASDSGVESSLNDSSLRSLLTPEVSFLISHLFRGIGESTGLTHTSDFSSDISSNQEGCENGTSSEHGFLTMQHRRDSQASFADDCSRKHERQSDDHSVNPRPISHPRMSSDSRLNVVSSTSEDGRRNSNWRREWAELSDAFVALCQRQGLFGGPRVTYADMVRRSGNLKSDHVLALLQRTLAVSQAAPTPVSLLGSAGNMPLSFPAGHSESEDGLFLRSKLTSKDWKHCSSTHSSENLSSKLETGQVAYGLSNLHHSLDASEYLFPLKSHLGRRLLGAVEDPRVPSALNLRTKEKEEQKDLTFDSLLNSRLSCFGPDSLSTAGLSALFDSFKPLILTQGHLRPCNALLCTAPPIGISQDPSQSPSSSVPIEGMPDLKLTLPSLSGEGPMPEMKRTIREFCERRRNILRREFNIEEPILDSDDDDSGFETPFLKQLSLAESSLGSLSGIIDSDNTTQGSVKKTAKKKFHPRVEHCQRKLVYTGCANGWIKCWDSNTGRLMSSFRGHSDAVVDLALSPDNSILVSCSMDSDVNVYDTLTNALLLCIHGTEGVPSTVLFKPAHIPPLLRDGHYELLVTFEGDVFAYQLSYDALVKGDDYLTEKCGCIARPPCLDFHCPRIRPDMTPEWLSRGNSWYTGEPDRPPPSQNGSLSSAANGDAISNGSVGIPGFERHHRRGGVSRERVRLLNELGGSRSISESPSPGSRSGDSCKVTAVAYHPHGRHIVCATLQGYLFVFDRNTHCSRIGQGPSRPVQAMVAHRSSINRGCLIFSSDGRFLVSGSEDGTFAVWKVSHLRKTSTLYAQLLTKTAPNLARSTLAHRPSDGSSSSSASSTTMDSNPADPPSESRPSRRLRRSLRIARMQRTDTTDPSEGSSVSPATGLRRRSRRMAAIRARGRMEDHHHLDYQQHPQHPASNTDHWSSHLDGLSMPDSNEAYGPSQEQKMLDLVCFPFGRYDTPFYYIRLKHLSLVRPHSATLSMDQRNEQRATQNNQRGRNRRGMTITLRGQGKSLSARKKDLCKVHCLRFSLGDDYLLIGGTKGALNVVRMRDLRLTQLLSGHKSSAIVRCVESHPTLRNVFVSGASDGRVQLWDLRSGRSLRVFCFTHVSSVTGLSWLHSGLSSMLAVTLGKGLLCLLGFEDLKKYAETPGFQYFLSDFMESAVVCNTREGRSVVVRDRQDRVGVAAQVPRAAAVAARARASTASVRGRRRRSASMSDRTALNVQSMMVDALEPGHWDDWADIERVMDGYTLCDAMETPYNFRDESEIRVQRRIIDPSLDWHTDRVPRSVQEKGFEFFKTIGLSSNIMTETEINKLENSALDWTVIAQLYNRYRSDPILFDEGYTNLRERSDIAQLIANTSTDVLLPRISPDPHPTQQETDQNLLLDFQREAPQIAQVGITTQQLYREDARFLTERRDQELRLRNDPTAVSDPNLQSEIPRIRIINEDSVAHHDPSAMPNHTNTNPVQTAADAEASSLAALFAAAAANESSSGSEYRLEDEEESDSSDWIPGTPTRRRSNAAGTGSSSSAGRSAHRSRPRNTRRTQRRRELLKQRRQQRRELESQLKTYQRYKKQRLAELQKEVASLQEKLGDGGGEDGSSSASSMRRHSERVRVKMEQDLAETRRLLEEAQQADPDEDEMVARIVELNQEPDSDFGEEDSDNSSSIDEDLLSHETSEEAKAYCADTESTSAMSRTMRPRRKRTFTEHASLDSSDSNTNGTPKRNNNATRKRRRRVSFAADESEMMTRITDGQNNSDDNSGDSRKQSSDDDESARLEQDLRKFDDRWLRGDWNNRSEWAYTPQLGDLVVYIWQSHRQCIQLYGSNLDRISEDYIRVRKEWNLESTAVDLNDDDHSKSSTTMMMNPNDTAVYYENNLKFRRNFPWVRSWEDRVMRPIFARITNLEYVRSETGKAYAIATLKRVDSESLPSLFTQTTEQLFASSSGGRRSNNTRRSQATRRSSRLVHRSLAVPEFLLGYDLTRALDLAELGRCSPKSESSDTSKVSLALHSEWYEDNATHCPVWLAKDFITRLLEFQVYWHGLVLETGDCETREIEPLTRVDQAPLPRKYRTRASVRRDSAELAKREGSDDTSNRNMVEFLMNHLSVKSIIFEMTAELRGYQAVKLTEESDSVMPLWMGIQFKIDRRATHERLSHLFDYSARNTGISGGSLSSDFWSKYSHTLEWSNFWDLSTENEEIGMEFGRVFINNAIDPRSDSPVLFNAQLQCDFARNYLKSVIRRRRQNDPFHWFIEDVDYLNDKGLFYYPSYVAVLMCFQRIYQKCQHCEYRQIDHLRFDIKLIQHNAHQFNQEGSVVFKHANQCIEQVLQQLDHHFNANDSSNDAIPALGLRRSHRRRTLPLASS